MTESAYPGFLESDIPPASFEEARIHVIPAEMEKSVSYGTGTGAGPRAILEASLQLEAFDNGTIPGRAGIYTHEPIPCRSQAVEDDLAEISGVVAGVIKKKGIPVILGGEHTVTLGALKPFADSGANIGVIQFDAHADLRDTYEGNRLSHACVMRRVYDLGLPFVQIGIRSLSEEEYIFRREHAVPHLDADVICNETVPDEILPRDFPEQLYITFDVDCFDVSVMPATGTPEPGGLTWYQVMNLLQKAVAGRTICGCDMVELAPVPAMPGFDFTAAKLVYKLMGLAVA